MPIRSRSRSALGLVVSSALISCGGSERTSGPACETLTGPTIHATDINVSETWTKCGNPHIVRGLIDVMAASTGAATPILTIGPGVEVQFDVSPAAGTFRFFRVGYFEPGGIVINGTTQEPVTFTSGAASPAPGDYTGIAFLSKTTGSSIKHLIIQDCGESPALSAGIDGCIVAQAVENPILMQDVTVRRSLTNGVVFAEQSAWAAGSKNLRISDVAQYPITTMPWVAHTLPTGGTYTNNGENYIRLWGDGNVPVTASWINPGIPYVVNTMVDVDALDGDDAIPTLTVAPGTTFRMGEGTSFRIGYFEGGGLRANGTAAAPISFVADHTAPTPGFWIGLEFAEHASNSLLNHVLVESAGDFIGYVPGDDGNVFVRTATGPTVTNSTFRFSAGCGIVIGRYKSEGFSPTPTSYSANTFNNNAMAGVCGPYDG